MVAVVGSLHNATGMDADGRVGPLWTCKDHRTELWMKLGGSLGHRSNGGPTDRVDSRPVQGGARRPTASSPGRSARKRDNVHGAQGTHDDSGPWRRMGVSHGFIEGERSVLWGSQ